MVHILPAAGSATRIGGIPKFLLPIGPNSKTLLAVHIEIALAAKLEVKLVVNPLLADYVSKYVGNAQYEQIQIVSYESKSMTDSILKAIEDVGDEEIVSITMPDTYIAGFSHKQLIDGRKKAPSLSVISLSGKQHEKLGQVKIDESDRVLKILDKSTEKISDYAWMGFAMKVESIRNFPREDATPGFELARMAENKTELNALRIEGKYFDCGTIHDYWSALGNSLAGKC